MEREVEPWLFFSNEIPLSDMKFNWKTVEDVVSDMVGLEKIRKVSLQEFHNHKWSKAWHFSLFGVSGLAFVVGMVALIIIGGLFCQYQRGQRRANERRRRREGRRLEILNATQDPQDQSE